MVTDILHLFAATEEAGGIAALGIDPLAILAQAATFLLLFWIVKRFALGKIVETLEKRRKTIDDGIRLGLKMAGEEEQLQERIEKTLKEARAEADKIIAAGHTDAGNLLKAAEENAARKMQTMLDDAHARIGEDLEKARKELEKEMLTLIAKASETVLGEKLDSASDSRLIERSLEEAKR